MLQLVQGLQDGALVEREAAGGSERAAGAAGRVRPERRPPRRRGRHARRRPTAQEDRDREAAQTALHTKGEEDF